MTRRRWKRGILVTVAAVLACGAVTLGALAPTGVLVVGLDPLSINTSPERAPPDPVRITADHSRCLATDSIHVTVANHLTTPVVADDGQASCSILALQVQVHGAWVTSAAGGGCSATCGIHCNLITPPRPVTIPPRRSYTAAIQHNQGAPFPPGTYRLALTYVTDFDFDVEIAGDTVWTAPFTIVNVLPPPPPCDLR